MAQVSAEFFVLIGIQPAAGRLFTRDEDREGQDAVALLDSGFWRREFGGANVLGRTIVLRERPVTIIGILPPQVRLAGLGAPDVWVPLAARGSVGGGGRGGILAVGRLRPGLSRENAQAEMDVINRRIARERTGYRTGNAVVQAYDEWLVGEVRGRFMLLLGAAVFVLLIVCANMANLMLARGTGRMREMAIRASLGAGRARLAAQMLTESLLLAVMGGLLGTALAFAIVRVVPSIRAIEIPRAAEITVDGAFLLIAVGVSLASGVIFGLAPAWQAWRRDIVPGRRRHGLREALAAAQLALAMVLLSGAGLMTNTLVRLLNVDLGFARSNVLRVSPSLPFNRYDRAARARFLRQAAEEVRRMPGVESATVATAAPLNESLGEYNLSWQQAGERRTCDALARDVDPGYFRTLGIPLLAGRDFEPADATRKPVPVILNTAAARMLFGAEQPLGKLVGSGYRAVGTMEVVGVVGDVRLFGVTRQPGPQAYAPLMGGWGYASQVIARATSEPAVLAPGIRASVRTLDAQLPPPETTTLDEVFSAQVARPRFYTFVLNASAILGLILAAIGIYGVIAFAVARRTREFAIRLALGAEPADIVRLVLASGARIVATGAVLGLAGALAATRRLSSLLYGVTPRGPFTLLLTGGLLVAVALAACRLAARRVSGVNLDPSLFRD